MAFNWFRKKPAPARYERLTRAIPKVMSAYGALMTRYPQAILDTSELPLPKAEMKLLLKLAWLLNDDPHTRNAVEIGYEGLSKFQDGIGETPIDPTLPANSDPKNTLAILKPYLGISGKVRRESAELLTEFADFRRRGALP